MENCFSKYFHWFETLDRICDHNHLKSFNEDEPEHYRHYIFNDIHIRRNDKRFIISKEDDEPVNHNLSTLLKNGVVMEMETEMEEVNDENYLVPKSIMMYGDGDTLKRNPLAHILPEKIFVIKYTYQDGRFKTAYRLPVSVISQRGCFPSDDEYYNSRGMDVILKEMLDDEYEGSDPYYYDYYRKAMELYSSIEEKVKIVESPALDDAKRKRMYELIEENPQLQRELEQLLKSKGIIL